MMKQDVDWTCGIGAVNTRTPFERVVRSYTDV
jgi:hypothetical protein